jgi:nicotinamidase/pyrazinamidase
MAARMVFVDVDVQRDFCEPTGALFVPGSPNASFRELTRYAVEHRIPILGSVDSHAWDAWEFASSDTPAPAGEKPNFPDHCVKGTAGWLKIDGTLPPRFRFVPNVPVDAGRESASAVPFAPFESIVQEVVRTATQGVYFEKEVYSLFANPLAERFLKALFATFSEPPELFVYGVATDYCVKAAALGLRARGYATTLITDAIAGITPEGSEAALREMTDAGVSMMPMASLIGARA